MKKLILTALLITVSGLCAVSMAHTEDKPFITDLIAGQTVDVGDVLVWNDGDNLYIKYKIAEDTTPLDNMDNWAITNTHVHIVKNVDEIPQKNGNPIPGQFTYKNAYYYVDETPPLAIPLNGWTPGTVLNIAAHADVEVAGGLLGLEMYLPDTVTMKVTYPVAGGSAYFPNVSVTGGTILDGTYSGWCVDTEHVIYQNTNYTANVYSSYETIEGLVDHPENMDLVNWILNKGYVGKTSPGGYGVYTYGDVQRAIWTLVDDNPSTAGLGSWDQNRVNEILADAQANGEGYEPGCGDIVAVILAPVNSTQVIIAQVIIFELEIF